ncbi:MAG: hypothetical protein J0I41_08020 [Filimonas sp.]|nr:hypothetical protein [Filimonas sp.]
MSDCTTENLLLYLYGELTQEENEIVEGQLKENWSLREKLQVLKEAGNRLDNTRLLSPRQHTVQEIMHYAARKVSIAS